MEPSQRMTLEQIKAAFPDQYVLLDDLLIDERTHGACAGRVIATPARDARYSRRRRRGRLARVGHSGSPARSTLRPASSGYPATNDRHRVQCSRRAHPRSGAGRGATRPAGAATGARHLRLLGEAVSQAIEKQKTAKIDAASLAPSGHGRQGLLGDGRSLKGAAIARIQQAWRAGAPSPRKRGGGWGGVRSSGGRALTHSNSRPDPK
jgi:hypothetical protein